jgi:hypothetical protein
LRGISALTTGEVHDGTPGKIWEEPEHRVLLDVEAEEQALGFLILTTDVVVLRGHVVEVGHCRPIVTARRHHVNLFRALRRLRGRASKPIESGDDFC